MGSRLAIIEFGRSVLTVLGRTLSRIGTTELLFNLFLARDGVCNNLKRKESCESGAGTDNSMSRKLITFLLAIPSVIQQLTSVDDVQPIFYRIYVAGGES